MGYFIGVLIILILLVAIPLISVYRCGKKHIISLEEVPNDYEAVLVLGAGIRKDGKPCDLLADRLEVGAMAYVQASGKYILLTGDNSDESRREVDVMKEWIKDKHLKDNHTMAIAEINDNDLVHGNKAMNGSNAILLDNKGVCTFDSMYRACKIFKIRKVIVSTNSYHLPRALYIGKRLGMEVCGVPSDLRTYDRMKKYRRREILAQIKDYYQVNIFK